MKATPLPPRYQVTDDNGIKYEVIFVPVKGVPNFTHKVFLSSDGNQLTIRPYWMGAHVKPSGKVAVFFVGKYLGIN